MILTDNPDTTTGFLCGSQWKETTLEDLSPTDATGWSTFGSPNKPLWRCATSSQTPVAGVDERLIIIDHAPSSQFDDALQAVKGGVELPDGLTVIALEGVRFRGQRNRPWTALRGNLHYTAHYTLEAPAEMLKTSLTLLPVVATAQAIAEASGGKAQPTVKWVNDLFIEDAKVAGVLTASQVQGTAVQRVVFGVGVNVSQVPHIVSTPFVPRAGSLASFDIALPDLLRALMRQMNNGIRRLRTGDFDWLFDAYVQRASFIGRRVRIWPETVEGRAKTIPIIEGEVLALYPDLSLRIRDIPEPVWKGRMELLNDD